MILFAALQVISVNKINKNVVIRVGLGFNDYY